MAKNLEDGLQIVHVAGIYRWFAVLEFRSSIHKEVRSRRIVMVFEVKGEIRTDAQPLKSSVDSWRVY